MSTDTAVDTGSVENGIASQALRDLHLWDNRLNSKAMWQENTLPASKPGGVNRALSDLATACPPTRRRLLVPQQEGVWQAKVELRSCFLRVWMR